VNRPMPQLEANLARPLAVAEAMSRGEAGAWPIDTWIILSAIISSVASCVWPGTRIDRQRFIEAWMRFGVDEGKLISRPLLMQTLVEQGRHADGRDVAAEFSEILDRANLPPLMGRTVDANETVLAARYPTVTTRTLRDHSYPSIFYEHVRSGLAHEYELGNNAALRTEQTGASGVSYTRPVGSGIRIYFHTAWLLEQARTIARNAEAALVAVGAPTLPKPSPWWSDG
jgi:hypothetical protein